jgi:hypothetical protein
MFPEKTATTVCLFGFYQKYPIKGEFFGRKIEFAMAWKLELHEIPNLNPKSFVFTVTGSEWSGMDGKKTDKIS